MTLSRRQLLAYGSALLAGCTRRDLGKSGEMARDQLIFGAWLPEPVVVLLVLQRQRSAEGQPVALEAKAFIAARGDLKLLFFDRVALQSWPEDLAAAVTAWQQAGQPRTARPSFERHGTQLTLGVQLPAGGLQLSCPNLQPAGHVSDPHGQAELEAGVATLTLNGQTWQGQLLAERLMPGAQAWVHYHRFAMWAIVLESGALLLGRVGHGQVGQDAVHAVGGVAGRIPLAVEVVEQSDDAATHLPRAHRWRLGTLGTVNRTGGSTSRGQSPSGGPALYDLVVAQGDGLLALASALSD